MANESNEIRVFGDGGVYIADVGTAFPTDVSTPIDPDSGWTNLGYHTTEGTRFSFGQDTTDLNAWQTLDPVRVLVSAAPTSISFDLMQTNRHSLTLALGGGAITEPTAGLFKFTPADVSEIYERAVVVELTDGEFNYRYCYTKMSKDGAVEFSAVRTDSTNFSITMKLLAPPVGQDRYAIYSDDPNMTLLEAGS